MATDTHSTTRPLTPGQIEMEGLRASVDRLKGYHGVFLDIEGPVDEACVMADLAMTWWDKVQEERRSWRDAGGGELIITDREQRIVAFAFGNLWTRLTEIDKRMSRPQEDA